MNSIGLYVTDNGKCKYTNIEADDRLSVAFTFHDSVASTFDDSVALHLMIVWRLHFGYIPLGLGYQTALVG